MSVNTVSKTKLTFFQPYSKELNEYLLRSRSPKPGLLKPGLSSFTGYNNPMGSVLKHWGPTLRVSDSVGGGGAG